jgi:hypothetical protein
MQALETASRQETDDIDSDSNHSDLVNDAPENASRDVVEDFARKLDQCKWHFCMAGLCHPLALAKHNNSGYKPTTVSGRRR